jgi:hypothetical protein
MSFRSDFGLRTALFFTRAYARMIRRGLTEVLEEAAPTSTPLRTAVQRLEHAMDDLWARAKLAA